MSNTYLRYGKSEYSGLLILAVILYRLVLFIDFIVFYKVRDWWAIIRLKFLQRVSEKDLARIYTGTQKNLLKTLIHSIYLGIYVYFIRSLVRISKLLLVARF